MRLLFAYILMACFTMNNLSAQPKFTVDGYLSSMASMQFMKDSSDKVWDYVLHNRINTSWYASDNFHVKLQVRNQFLWGESIEIDPAYPENSAADKGFFDMNWNLASGKNTILNTQVDRFFAQYTHQNFELTLGRQRINWGRSLVWNPNDLFNVYSYYDFDYPERPGSDAFRAVYYSGTASTFELAGKLDSANHLSIAGLTKFNKWAYDIQFLAGYSNGQDFVLGFGWEGSLKLFSFRGEASYFHPQKAFSDSLGVLLATLGTDYTFKNNLTLQAEFLYNDKKSRASLTDLMTEPGSAKSLSPSRYNFFVNFTYPITPIVSVYAAGMYYTDQNGFFLMPGIDVSLQSTLNFSIIYQYFNIEVFNQQRISMNRLFARLKWNF
jgi:hypothetical protein